MQSTSVYLFLFLKSHLPHKSINFSEEIMNKIKIFVCVCLFQSGPDVNPGTFDPTNPTLLEMGSDFSIHALRKTPPVPIMAFNPSKTLLLYL